MLLYRLEKTLLLCVSNFICLEVNCKNTHFLFDNHSYSCKLILQAGGIIKEKRISQTKSKETVCLEEIT